eukprot:5662631-Amphidinium_carterae.1
MHSHGLVRFWTLACPAFRICAMTWQFVRIHNGVSSWLIKPGALRLQHAAWYKRFCGSDCW